MGAVIEVKYFNSFLLKKIPAATATPTYGTNNTLLYLGSFGIPTDIGGYARNYNNGDTEVDESWVIEESRIRGGYNNTTVDFGVRAYTTTEEPEGFIRGNTLIYSGRFLARVGSPLPSRLTTRNPCFAQSLTLSSKSNRFIFLRNLLSRPPVRISCGHMVHE